MCHKKCSALSGTTTPHLGCIRPEIRVHRAIQVALEHGRQLGQIEKQVIGRLDDGGSAARLAAGLLELHGIYELSTFVTLVAARIRVCAEWTNTFHEAICQELAAVLTVQLLNRLRKDESLAVQAFENRLGNLRLLLGARAAKVIELNVEPVVDFFVLLVILGANLGACQALLQRFRFRGCAVFVRAAQEERIQALDATVFGEDVCAQAAAD